MPREARGAARLREAHRPLGVRRRRRREEEAGDDEDDRRQPEREEGGYAEGVVDRRADVAVRGGEEGVRPEDALELVRLATPSCHGGTVVPAAVAPAPRPGRWRSSRGTARRAAAGEPRAGRHGGSRAATRPARRRRRARRGARPRRARPPRRAPGPRADDLAPHRDAVRGRDRGRGLEPLLQAHELSVEVCVERQLALERRAGATSTIRAPRSAASRQARSSACSVSSRSSSGTTMRAVGDRARPAREAPRAAVEQSDVGELHRMSWYGTEARITFGSTSSRRFT